MTNLLGEFDCKLDDRNRLIVPVGLLKQLPGVEEEGFVINRGFEKHLTLYTKKQWDKIIDDLSSLNQYEQKSRQFLRYFTRGATQLKMDKSFRILLPQQLMDYAGIATQSEIVVSCVKDKIEIWAVDAYEEQMNIEPADFASLAEEVMGNKARRSDD
jgi:MraZ protein